MVDTKEIQAAENALSITRQTFEDNGYTIDNIAKELALIAFADMADFIQIDSEGSVKPIAIIDLAPGKSRIIRKIKEKRRILNGKEDDTILEDTFEFELYSKLDAIKMGVDIMGLNAPVKTESEETHNYNLSPELQEMFDLIYANGKKKRGKK